MHPTIHDTTILALHLRVQRFGFAVLRSRPQLLDWGIKTYCATDAIQRARLAQKRIAPLLALFRPTVLVANHVTSRNVSSRSGHYHIVRAIEKMARKQSAELVLFSRGDMQRVFGTASAITKEGIAAQVALMFSELTWKLPPVRKTWETEHHNMPIFDAVAIGITYFTLIGDAARANPQSPQTRTPG